MSPLTGCWVAISAEWMGRGLAFSSAIGCRERSAISSQPCQTNSPPTREAFQRAA